MKADIAVFYVAGGSQYLRQESYLYQMLTRMADTVYVVCQQAEAVGKALQVDRGRLLECMPKDRLQAYQQAYNYFKLYAGQAKTLLFCDNSFFGPFYPLNQYAEEAEKRKLDYWAVNRYFEWMDYKYIVRPSRIDTSFICFTARMTGDKAIDFLRDEGFFDGDLEKDEEKLSGKLDECHAVGSTVTDYSGLESDNPLNHMDWLAELPFSMMKDCNCPVLMKSCFRPNLLRYTNENEIMKSLKFIEEKTDYDINIIWDYLLGNYNIADVMDILRIRMVVPERESDRKIYQEKKCAIIMHITYSQAVNRCMEYISHIPKDIHLYIVSKGECLEVLRKRLKDIKREKIMLLQAEEKGRDVSSLLVACKKYLLEYDYVCFLHDNKTRNNLGPAVIGASYMWERWDSMVKSESYINNVLEEFENNPRLGLVLAPLCYYGGTFNLFSWTWGGRFQAVCNLAERIGLNVDIAPEKYNCSIGTTFWCRAEAFRKLFASDISIDDFPPEPMPVDGTISHAVEQILPYVAQDAGYYTVIAESAEHAERYISDLTFIIRNMMNQADIPRSPYFDTYVSNLNMRELENFIAANKRLYIYGNGFLARQTGKLLEKHGAKCEAYIVSDGEDRKQREGEKVICFSELEKDDKDAGVIVALGGYYQREVVPNLRSHGFHSLFFI